MKHQFTIEIPNAPDARTAFRQLQKIGTENRLGEFVTQVARVTETPATWREALKPRRKKLEGGS